MPTHPDDVRRRIAPDEVQVQVILGSLLGDGAIVGRPGARRLRIVHAAERIAYASWKHDRLAAFVASPLRLERELVWFDTIPHPVFDDLVPFFYARPASARRVDREPILGAGACAKRIDREPVLARLAPLGLAVWMSDVGRSQLRADVFLPAQARLALIA